jgi:hypothetical protein
MDPVPASALRVFTTVFTRFGFVPIPAVLVKFAVPAVIVVLSTLSIIAPLLVLTATVLKASFDVNAALSVTFPPAESVILPPVVETPGETISKAPDVLRLT